MSKICKQNGILMHEAIILCNVYAMLMLCIVEQNARNFEWWQMWTKSQTTIALANVIRCNFFCFVFSFMLSATFQRSPRSLFLSLCGCDVRATAFISSDRIYLPPRPTKYTIYIHIYSAKLASNQIFSWIFISDLALVVIFVVVLVFFSFCSWYDEFFFVRRCLLHQI